MDTIFTVSWIIHNKEENEWNSAVVDKFTSQDAAEKEWHRQLSMYIDDPQFDSVVVFLNDSRGGSKAGFWTSVVTPVPPID